MGMSNGKNVKWENLKCQMGNVKWECQMGMSNGKCQMGKMSNRIFPFLNSPTYFILPLL